MRRAGCTQSGGAWPRRTRTGYVGHPWLGLTSVSAPPGWPRKRSTPTALLGYTYWFLKLSVANIQFVFGGGSGEAMHSTALT